MPIPPREECKFPAGREPAATALGHTFVPPAEKGLRLGDLGREGKGGRAMRAGKSEEKGDETGGETNSSAERNNIRGRYSRFVEAAGPFDSDRGRKERRESGLGHRSIGRNCA